ncbi:MAG: hypothetical protein HYV53_04680 [Parcubacteria group bacterium]|nr:hypothetical protein [Parcubacteria group bacterium]
MDIIKVLLKLAEKDCIEKPRASERMGTEYAFRAQKIFLEKGYYFTEQKEKVPFRVEGYEIIFPPQEKGEEEKIFNLLLWA